jgi:hypothetical protein
VSAAQPLERVREIRDEIEQRVCDFVETRVDDVRTDETAHRLRLQKVIPSLVEEFGDEKPAEEIRTCADAVLAEFADVPVRSFVPAFRNRLQAVANAPNHALQNGNRSQPHGNSFGLFRPFSGRSDLPLIAIGCTRGLHEGSILCNQSRQQIRR